MHFQRLLSDLGIIVLAIVQILCINIYIDKYGMYVLYSLLECGWIVDEDDDLMTIIGLTPPATPLT